MKKLLFLFLLPGFLSAQTFEETLKKNFEQLDTAKTVAQMMSASAALDLLVIKNPTEGMAYYYAAYAKAMTSYFEPVAKRKDLLLDMGDKYYAKVLELYPTSEETYILGALLANARLVVDGGSRWKEFGDLFNERIEKAKSINPNNPRIYLLKGRAVFFTPKMFGGGSKNAKPFFDIAKELFPAQNESSILIPYWGKNQNDYFLSQCTE